MEDFTGGIEYPKIEIGGKVYTVKFSPTVLYRMGKADVGFSPKNLNGQGLFGFQKFSEVVDILHVVIGFQGSHEELAELVHGKKGEAVGAIFTAWVKAFPPTQPAAPESSGSLAGPTQQVQ